MTTINFGGGTVSIAPLGTDPDDTATWQPIGVTTGPIHLIVDEPEPLLPWEVSAPYTITLTARSALTWYGHRRLFGRTHPDARRVKTAYHQRRR